MNEDLDGPWDFNEFIHNHSEEEEVEDSDAEDEVEDSDAEDEGARYNPLSLVQIAGEEIGRILTSYHFTLSDEFISVVKILGELSNVSFKFYPFHFQ